MDIPSLIKGRYKVICRIDEGKGYKSVRAADIEDPSLGEYVINAYEGEERLRFAGIYAALKNCPEFTGWLDDGRLLYAVFKWTDGPVIDDVLYKGAALSWDLRLGFTRSLFHLALCAAGYPPEVGCAALLSKNLVALADKGTFCVNYSVPSWTGLCEHELIYLLLDQTRKTLIKRFARSRDELEFTQALYKGDIQTVAQAYALWSAMGEKMAAGYEGLYAQSALTRNIKFAGAYAGRLFDKRVSSAKGKERGR